MNNEVSNEILERMNELDIGLKELKQSLSLGSDAMQFFHDGVQAQRNRWQRKLDVEKHNSVMYEMTARMQCDEELRYPHRKILDYLLQQFDYQKNEFKEIYFSKLVKATRIAKFLGNEYLTMLEKKGYVDIRKDGYRNWYRIRSVDKTC